MKARGLAVGLAMALAGPVAAQDGLVCSPGHIADLSQRILDEREDLGGFRTRRFGDTAAYLLYHYAGLSDAEMFGLLDTMLNGEPRTHSMMAREMQLALAVSRDGAAALEMFGRTAGEEFQSSHWHLKRAIMLLDDGETYFNLIRNLRQDPDADEMLLQPMMLGSSVLMATLDMDDARRLRAMEYAEAAGEIELAAILAANLQDRSIYEQLVTRYSGDENAWFLDREGIDSLAAVWATQSISWRTSPEPTYAQNFQAVRMAAQSGAADWTSLALNMTGLSAEIGQLGDEYLSKVGSGALSPYIEQETVWMWQYRRLAMISPDSGFIVSLTGFDWPSTSIRHFAAQAQRSMEIMILLDALTPVVQGADWSVAPDYASEFEFEALRPLVMALQAGEEVVPQSPEEAMYAFELLWRSGDLEGAVAFADTHMEPAAKLSAFRDVSRRMDALCDQVLVLPGQSLILGGGVIYQFPPQVRNE